MNSIKKTFMTITLIHFSILVFGFCYAQIGDVLKVLNVQGKHSTGLTFDGKYLWLADRKMDKVYQINIQTGKVENEIPTPGFSPTGLAWDGDYLWTIDDKERLLYGINVKTQIAEKIIEAYTNNPKDICWDGKLLWIVDDKLDLILSIDPEDGMMINNFPAPSSDPDGLTFDGKYFWITDRIEDMIYKVDPYRGEVILSIHSPNKYPRGLAWDGEFLWNVDYQSDKIYKIKIEDDLFMARRDEKIQQLENTFDFRNYGPDEVTLLDVYIAIPENRDNQEILPDIRFEPSPQKILTDQWGQKVAHFQVKNLKGDDFFRATMTVKAKISAVEYFINPDKVGAINEIPYDVKEQYLVNGKKLMITDPFIKDLAASIVGDEKNPYWIVRKIYNYLINNLTYNLKPVGGWNTAPTVLKRGTASCSEYSFSMIALCRAAGIPARYVGAVSLRGDDASLDEVFHRWCEIYLPNYGWIPFDANKGDKALPADQASGIGNIASRYIITTTSGGDSEFMDWTYNFNYHWQSKGKCRVYTEYYGDWSPAQ